MGTRPPGRISRLTWYASQPEVRAGGRAEDARGRGRETLAGLDVGQDTTEGRARGDRLRDVLPDVPVPGHEEVAAGTLEADQDRHVVFVGKASARGPDLL